MKAQVTLFDKSGKHRPVSCLVPIEKPEDIKEKKEEIKTRGIRKIMITRDWTKKDLLTYNFLTCKIRLYPES